MPVKKHPFGLILLCWMAGATVFALSRSFWGDELVRLGQAKLSLSQGLALLFQEPSPFAPGETVLNFIFRLLFSRFLPEELWTRLPSLLFGALSLFIVSRLKESSAYKTVLSVLLFFSVAFWSLAIEMRPYGALIFSGALAFFIIEAKQQSLKKSAPLLILAMLFSHLYGVCYLAYAFFFRKRWLEFGLSVFFVLVVLALSYKQGAWSNPFSLSLIEVSRQTFGLLGNPHKGSYVLLPFFAWGLFVRLRKNRNSFLAHVWLLFFTIVMPILVTVASSYYFVPRQCCAGIFPFLAITVYGMVSALDRIPFKVVKNAALVVVLFFSSALPWGFAILFNQPPFPDQPRHRFKGFVSNLVNAPGKGVLVSDPCSGAAVSYYAEKAWGVPLSKKKIVMRGVSLERVCYRNSSCFYTPTNDDYCSASDVFFSDSKKAALLLMECKKSFELIIYGSEKFAKSECDMVRSW